MGETNLRTYIGILAAFAVTLAACWTYWYGATTEVRFMLGAAVFVVLLVLADAFPIRISEHGEISTVEIGQLAAVVMLGPLWATLAAVPCAALTGRKDWLRTAYEASCVTIEIYLAGIVFSFASGPLLGAAPESTASAVYAALAAGVTMVGANKALNMGLLRVKYRQTFEETWQEIVEPFLLSHAVAILTVGLGILILLTRGPVAALVMVAGSLASQVLVYRSREQAKENRELRARVGSLEQALTTSNTTFGTMVIRDLGARDGTHTGMRRPRRRTRLIWPAK